MSLRWMTSILFTVLLLIGTLPFIPLVWTALFGTTPWPLMSQPDWSVHGWSVWREQAWLWAQAGVVSVGIAAAVTALNVLLAWPAADALVRSDMHGKALIRAWLYAPLLLPAFVPLMGIHFGFVRMGLSDSISGVILAHLLPTFPYVLSSLMSGFATLGKSWEEQARMLGASRWQRFVHVVFPVMKPALVAGCSLSVLVSMSQYLITLLVGGGQVKTVTIILFPYMNGGDPGTAAQLLMAFVGFSLLLLWGMQRHLLQRGSMERGGG
jgi:putative spermidine/putrescine transport system permease protein